MPIPRPGPTDYQDTPGYELDVLFGSLCDLAEDTAAVAAAHAANTSNPHSVNKSQVGLGSVDNTSDAGKPVSTAQQTALDLKANLASPTFTGTVGGVTASMVGAPAGSGTSTGTNTGDSATPAETTTTVGSLINGATSKSTPVDADQLGLMDSAASNVLKKLSWANVKATLQSVFATLAGTSGGQTLYGGTASSETLTLRSTSNATRGKVIFGSLSTYDEGNDRLGIGTTTPATKLHVGSSSANNSVDSVILISRAVNDSLSGNGHAYSDSSALTRSGGIAYASYDARITIPGTNSYDHYAAYQNAPVYSSSGTITHLYGLASVPTISGGVVTNVYGLYSYPSIGASGTVTNMYGAHIKNPSNNGVVKNNYGVYVAQLSVGNTNNYAIYTEGSTPSFIKGAIQNNSGIVVTHVTGSVVVPGKQIEAQSAFNSEAAIRIRQVGQNYWDLKSVAATTRFDISDVVGTYLTILSGGNIGIGVTAPTAVLTLKAGTSAASTAPIKFTSGTLNTTAEAGAIEFLNDDLYLTRTTGPVRSKFVTTTTGRATGQTAANASVAAHTVGAADGSYEVSANVLVTTSSAENFTVTVAYTDEGNTARTVTLNFQTIAGTIGTAVNFANGAVPYEGLSLHLRVKASTTITVATTGTFTGSTYNVEAIIRKV